MRRERIGDGRRHARNSTPRVLLVTTLCGAGAMIAAIAAAAQEQMQGIGRVNQAVTQMDEMTKKNALLAEQIVESTTTMLHHAQQTEQ